MIDTSKLYTKREASELERRGYEFVEIAPSGSREGGFMVASYTPPRRDLWFDENGVGHYG